VELQRYLRWLAGRPAAAAVRRMRGGAEQAARQELDPIAGELPAEIRPAVERLLLRTVHRLVHQPTLELRAAAEAGDGDLVRVLAGLFDAVPPDAGRREGAGQALTRGEPDAAGGQRHAPFDVQRPDVGAAEQAGHEGLVHPADKLAV